LYIGKVSCRRLWIEQPSCESSLAKASEVKENFAEGRLGTRGIHRAPNSTRF
jgi:hypothetical protein